MIASSINKPCYCYLFQIKGDVFAITNVPARHQIWSGWPAAADDDTVRLFFRFVKLLLVYN